MTRFHVYTKTLFELVFGECSHLLHEDTKKKEDEIKLWRETNDSMFWVQQGCKLEKGQFDVVGIQVAGNVSHAFSKLKSSISGLFSKIIK